MMDFIKNKRFFFRGRQERTQRILVLRAFAYVILALFLLFVITFSVCAVGVGRVLKQAETAKTKLEDSIELIKEKRFEEAGKLAIKAEAEFDRSLEALEGFRQSRILNSNSFARSSLNDAYYLLSAGSVASGLARDGASFGEEFHSFFKDGGTAVKEFSREEREEFLSRVYEDLPELSGLNANINLALAYLDHLELKSFFFPLKAKVEGVRSRLEEASGIMNKFLPIAYVLPQLAGYPEKSTYLVVIQNNGELRPTGGFIGTYGILELDAGEITRFDTHDSYHLDMPVKDKINVVPPAPLKKYLGISKWYFRDANWSPDWPASARKIQWFYERENLLLPAKGNVNNFFGKFDGVIAITPKIITDLLEITGPVTVGGKEYNKDNFVDLLQYEVEKGYAEAGRSSWDRKEAIGEIAKQIKIKLFNQPMDAWKRTADVVYDNLVRKNVLIYLNSEEPQKLVREHGFSGEVKDTAGDYLMIVDANMAAYKTDAVMGRRVDYAVKEEGGNLTGKLDLAYSHNGGFDWKTTTYRSYTRVYAPAGSRLISISGNSDNVVDIGNEFGKTYFGFFISIEPGEIKNVSLEYKLPFQLAKNYNLYVQKQPGKDINNFTFDLSSESNIKLYNPRNFYASRIGDNETRWESDILADKIFEVEME